MSDKEILTNVLTLTKNLNTLLLHATLESSTEDVFEVFSDALNEAKELQHAIYKCMENVGFYQVDAVNSTQLSEVQNKFTECNY